MPIPTWSVGQVLTASDVNSWFVPLAAYKSADLARTSTTTLTADPDLTVAVAANSVYLVTISLNYKGAATGTGDLKFGFTVPASATLTGWSLGVTNPLGVGIGAVTASSVLFSASNGTANPLGCEVTGTLITSSTAGNLVLTWAQNASNATATTLMTGSSLNAQKTG